VGTRNQSPTTDTTKGTVKAVLSGNEGMGEKNTRRENEGGARTEGNHLKERTVCARGRTGSLKKQTKVQRAAERKKPGPNEEKISCAIKGRDKEGREREAQPERRGRREGRRKMGTEEERERLKPHFVMTKKGSKTRTDGKYLFLNLTHRGGSDSREKRGGDHKKRD